MVAPLPNASSKPPTKKQDMAAARIALIHAKPLAIEPIAVAFAALWPEAVLAKLRDARAG